MELKEFISSTLSDIMDGISDSQNNIKQNKARIIPDRGRTFHVEFEIIYTDDF